MGQASLDKRELQTIRFLSLWAKKLVFALRTGKCSVTVLGHVEQCCERINDMAEYSHEDASIEQLEHELASNVRFMKDLAALDLGLQNVVGYLPGDQDLERLFVTHDTEA